VLLSPAANGCSCHHALAEALRTYIAVAGIAEDRKARLFRNARRRAAAALSNQLMTQPDAWRMIRPHRRDLARIVSAFENTTGLVERPRWP